MARRLFHPSFTFPFFLVVWIFISVSAKSSTFVRKQLAGPASEFSIRELPPTTIGSLISEYSTNFVIFQKNGDQFSWSSTLNVDSTENFAFSFTSPFENSLTLTLTDSNGAEVSLPTPFKELAPVGGESAPVSTYQFGNKLKPGAYTLKVTGDPKEIEPVRTRFDADGLVLVFNESPLKIYSHLLSYSLKKGETVGVRAMMYDQTVSSPSAQVPPIPWKSAGKMTAKLEIELPDGTDQTVEMHDDGLHNDLEANDGIYTGEITAAASGRYIAEPKFEGQDDSGNSFYRSTLHLFNVVDAPLSVGVTASGVIDGERMKIYLPVGPESDRTKTYRPYAEVWGKSGQKKLYRRNRISLNDDENQGAGEDVPVCWISNLAEIENYGGSPVLALELDLKWLKLANAQAPLTLKNVFVQEADYFVPLVSDLTIEVKSTQKLNQLVSQMKEVTSITREMKEGINPFLRTKRNSTSDGEKGKLVLLHGYCTKENPWAKSPEDWTNPAYFLNPGVSLSNDQFAQKVVEYVADFDSFSLIGHSQGGFVATHIHNYYFTGLEAATGGRLVQTVGTPYHGNSGAGVAACIGSIFGIGCGSNDDLTRDGSELWLRGITEDTRKDVYYYTTRYPDGFGEYCSLVYNLVLKNPNDGLAEIEFIKLEGGNNMGTTPGWCHSIDMKYSPQYTDHTRNKEMNEKAAR